MKFMLLLFSAVFCFTIIVSGQVSNETRMKLKSLKGDVQSITIVTDKGELTLTGEAAEEIYHLLKGPVAYSIPPHFYFPHREPLKFKWLDGSDKHWNYSGSDSDDVVILRKNKDGKKIKIYKSADSVDYRILHSDSLGLDNDADIFIEDGKEKIIIKRHIDREEESEEPEGKKEEE